MNPMVDGWMGDDWFHNGAFRQQSMPYIYEQDATRRIRGQMVDEPLRRLRHVHAGGLGGRTRPPPRPGAGRLLAEDSGAPRLRRLLARPGRGQLLAAQPLKVPVMLVHSLWDQEDIYGAPAVYKAIKPKDTNNDKVFLVHGPVASRPEDRRRQHAGRLEVRQRHRALFPPGDPAAVPRPVSEGRRAARPTSPPSPRSKPARTCGGACQPGRRDARVAARGRPTPLYLGAGLKLSFTAPKPGDAAFDEYISDPAKPVPFRARPIQPWATAEAYLAALAGRRSARSVRPPGRRGVRLRRADRAGEDQRAAHRQSGRLHQRHRLRLGRQADRRLSRRGGEPPGAWAATS